MSCGSSKNVTVVNSDRAPFAAHYESLSIGREHRPVVRLPFRSGVTLRDLIERKEEGS
jgi:hypothetical protein